MAQTGPALPTVSVVVAAWRDLAGVAACLQALSPQRGLAFEILVVSNVEVSRDLAERFAWVDWIKAEEQELTPQLWERGIRESRGEVVALTNAHFLPAPQWLSTIREAHARLTAPAIGGRIDPPRDRVARAWASFFLRYSQYLHQRVEQPVQDLAGDNATYKRAALQSQTESSGRGFWEQEFHGTLLQQGKAILFVPGIAVTQGASSPFWQFSRQRFRHGQRFGASRARRLGYFERSLRVATAPLIPAVFFAKILSRVVRDGRYLGTFVGCLPILVGYIFFWAAGETSGYLGAGSRGRAATPASRVAS